MTGAGKTSVGRLLARHWKLPFADSDETIERETGIAIPDWFDRFGESAFRGAERRVITRLADPPRKVIATGGGAFADVSTRALLLDSCLTIWLDIPVDQLARRLDCGGGRPLLRGPDPAERIATLAAERRLAYAAAHLSIRADDETVSSLAARIVEMVGGLVR